jgi:8-oxo-dGTP diphosphatase
MVRVGLGLISRDGCYLVRQRPELPNSPMPGYWEFPGGKCDSGESPEAAALRECREETGLDVRVVRERRVRLHRYPHGLVELHYFDCVPSNDAAEPTTGSGFRWIPVEKLATLVFPEANDEVLRDLAEERGR